jgi:hypothetical protein
MASNDGVVDVGVSKRSVAIVAATAVGMGLAVAGGSIVDGSGTSADAADTIPFAVVGGCAGLLVGCLITWFGRSFLPAGRGRRGAIGVFVVVVGCLGALVAVGSASGGDGVSTIEESASADEVGYRARSGETASGVAGPVDFDGDGRADVIESRPVLGFDADADGIADGILSECRTALDEVVPPDSLAISVDCSGHVDVLLPYDPRGLLRSGGLADPVPPERSTLYTVGFSETQITLILLVGLVLLLLAFRFFLRQIGEEAAEPEVAFLEVGAFPDDDGSPSAERVVTALERSLESLRDSERPIDSILAAYAALLDELDAVGLGRRPWEAPMEHCRRCLSDARLPDGPIDALVELFSRARFGGGEMTTADRDAARAALVGSIDLLGQRPVEFKA